MTAIRGALIAMVFAGLVPLHGIANPEAIATEVYRDENILIRATVLEQENSILSFGDILLLTVEIVYDTSKVRLQDTGPAFFTGSWPQSRGAYLLDYQTSLSRSEGRDVMQRHNLFRFQILGCPEGLMSCQGERHYEIPEFALQYHVINQNDEVIDSRQAVFRPAPARITVLSTLEPGDAGELLEFSEYFPTGAYPDPLLGRMQKEIYSGLIAGGVFLLLGGILMSPLSLFKRKAFIPKSRPRWELILEQLKAGKFDQDEVFLDEMRRCVVWYCTDELGVDPFYWVKRQEEMSRQQQKGMGEHSEFKDLFIDLLHNPPGQGKILLDRFQALLKKR
jgi:hypothetical protein